MICLACNKFAFMYTEKKCLKCKGNVYVNLHVICDSCSNNAQQCAVCLKHINSLLKIKQNKGGCAACKKIK